MLCNLQSNDEINKLLKIKFVANNNKYVFIKIFFLFQKAYIYI